MRPKKITIVHDMELDEHKREMLDAVEVVLKRRFEVEKIPFDETFFQRMKSAEFVFNLSTAGGRDSRQLHVPAVLDLIGVPYTASSALAHALCIDKSVTKIVLQHSGIPTPRFSVVKPGDRLENMNFDTDYPAIVKPVREGSAQGLWKDSVVNNVEELKRAVKRIHDNFYEPALVEEFVDGRECTVGLIGNGEDLEVLPILEIDFSHLPEGVERFYSYRVKNEIDYYLRFRCPTELDPKLERRIHQGCKAAFKVMGLRDYARMDVRIRDGEYYILEINSLPLLVPVYSDITKMAEAAGYGYEGLIMKILEASFERYGF